MIRLDLGEIKVRRTFKHKGEAGEFTTSLVVENGEGARYPSPQKMLDTLVDHLSFDPLAFTRMKARDQFDALRAFVPGVDFDAIDKANKDDFAARTVKNREVASLTARYQAIVIPSRCAGGARRHRGPRGRDGAGRGAQRGHRAAQERGASRPRPKWRPPRRPPRRGRSEPRG